MKYFPLETLFEELDFEKLGFNIIYPYNGFGKTDQEIKEFMKENDIVYDESTDILTIKEKDFLILSTEETEKQALKFAEDEVYENIEDYAGRFPRYLEMDPISKREFILNELNSLWQTDYEDEYEDYDDWYNEVGFKIEEEIEEDPMGYLEEIYSYGEMVTLDIVDYDYKGMAEDIVLEETAPTFLEHVLAVDLIDMYQLGNKHFNVFEM